MHSKSGTEQPLIDSVREFAAKESLWTAGDRILLAVSGGVDSVVLAYLLVQCGMDCAMAHCNFGLRKDEADRDEDFTSQIAQQLRIPFFSKQFRTYGYASEKGISVEMAARELRYTWFDQLIREQGFRAVATGHHADDQVETLLLNLARGTGVSGLRGMLPVSGNVIRPLLFLTRQEIRDHAVKSGIAWVEDSTNQTTGIKRNFIRHKLIPLFEEINPAFRESVIRSMRAIRETELISKDAAERQLTPLITHDAGELKISISGLKKLAPLPTYLFELLSPYGFNRASIEAVERSLTGLSGKQFNSATHRLVKDRDHLILTSKGKDPAADEWQYLIGPDEKEISVPVRMNFHRAKASDYHIPRDPGHASLDFDKLAFPLVLRRWQYGDTFIPFGMHNKKKLSNFFSDLKLSLVDKEHIYVVLSGDQIVYVAGYRIDNRYRITKGTREVFSITLLKG